MDKPLSFSGYKRYTTCPQFYKYHDVEQYRPGGFTSALAVGTICDEIVGKKLQGKQVDNWRDSFDYVSKYIEQRVEFFSDDLDTDLVDLSEVEKTARRMGWKGDDIKSALNDMTKSQDTLSVKQHILLSATTWDSLHVKIVAMLDSFDKWISPQIVSADHIQHELNERGIRGFLDFTCTLRDGRKVLMDLKTSKMPYAKDAAQYSPQLALYAALMGFEYAGFIVLVKTLNKNKTKKCTVCDYSTTGGNRLKCPKDKSELSVTMEPTSYSQLLVDSVSKQTKELTLNAMADTIKAIDKGVFPRNLNACGYLYGKPCIYRDRCWNPTKEQK
jgi:hypothetical protein